MSRQATTRSHGAPKNPWNFDYVTGGSSSGSAAAVASGSVVFAVGSDTGGSLRIPAHCCGVTSWKPTYGAMPLAGAMPLSPSLDTVGHSRAQRLGSAGTRAHSVCGTRGRAYSQSRRG